MESAGAHFPGTDHPRGAYFARGTGHDEQAGYSERPADFEKNMARLRRKLDTARRILPGSIREGSGRAEVGLIAYGSSHHALEEARAQLAEEGLETDYLRVRGYPFPEDVRAFVAAHDRVYVVEQNRDAQMLALLKIDLPAELVPRLRPLARVHGLPLDARSVTDDLLTRERAS